MQAHADTRRQLLSRCFTLLTILAGIGGVVAYPVSQLRASRRPLRYTPDLARALQKGLALNRELRYGDAARVFTNVLRARPGSADARLYRGLALYNAGRYRDSVADFSSILESSPNDGVVHLYRGEGYLAMGDRARAVGDFRRALALARDDGRLAVAARVQLERAADRTGRSGG